MFFAASLVLMLGVWLLSIALFYLVWFGNAGTSQSYYNLPALAPLCALFGIGVTAFLSRKNIACWPRLSVFAIFAALVLCVAPVLRYLFKQDRQILAAGDLRRIDLAGTKVAPAATGRAFWSQTEGLVVAFANLPATQTGQVYQLWVIPPGGTPLDAGLLELQPDGRALTLARSGTSERVGTVAITLEPAGGSPVPTLSNMIAAGTLAN